MIERIVVGFDGSELAREAFAYGSMLAGALAVDLLAVRVLELPPPIVFAGDPSVIMDPVMPPVVGAADEALLAEERSRAEREFEELRTRAGGVAFATRTVQGGVVEAIAGSARAGDLLCVGLAGRFRRTGAGSSTRWLVSHASCPVLVVSAPAHQIGRVAALFDGSIVSMRAVSVAREIARRAAWPLEVMAVTNSDLAADEAVEWAGLLAPGARVIGGGAETEAPLVERVLKNGAAALLVLGAYRHSWLHDLFAGSRTSQLVSALSAPMVLVRGAGGAG